MVNNTSELLVTFEIETVTGPVVAVAGTVATTCVSLQLVMGAVFPLNLRVFCVEPKPVPVTVTWVPVVPEPGLMLETCGGGTVKVGLFVLLIFPTTTLTVDVMAFAGTTATICVSDQLTTEITDPKVSVLVP